MELTNEILEEGRSKFGGWNRPQLELFGIHWPLKQGWKFKILGKEFAPSIIKDFLSLKDKHLTEKVIEKKEKKQKKHKEPAWYRAWKEKQDMNARMDYSIAKDD